MFMNILSLYHFTHLGLGKKVDFTPDSMSIFDMQEKSKIYMREVNHQSQLYNFSNFIEPDSYVLLMHVDDNSILWHERFVHLNFKYMHQISKKWMVTGLLDIHFLNGFVKDVSLASTLKRSSRKGRLTGLHLH
jgi:hypothetical protein